MKPRLQLLLFIVLLGFTGFLSCHKDDEVYNKLPVANAGPDQVVILPKDNAVLDGTASSDPDGTINKYLWSKISGPTSFTIVNTTSSRTTVNSLVQGVYEFELQVTDNRGATAKDTIKIMVNTGNGTNQPPVAYAGVDQSITVPTYSCTLNGSASYDPDGTIAIYQWSKIDGPVSFLIESPSTSTTIVRNLIQGIYQFQLEVTDNGSLTAKDTVQVTVNPANVAACDISGRALVTIRLTEIGSLSEPRIPYVAAAGNKVVFAGGVRYVNSNYVISLAVDIYNTNTGKWTQGQLSEAREGICAVSCGEKIFFAGGNMYFLASDIVDIYDAVSGEWTVAHLSEPRAYMAAAAVGNKVFFAGGYDNEGISKKVDIYDITLNTWTTAELSEARIELGAVSVGSKIYFAGGWNNWDLSKSSQRVDIYDNSSTTYQWSTSTLQDLSGPISGAAIGNVIYWGGIAKLQNLGKVEAFNTSNNTVTSTGCLSYPRIAPTAVVRNSEIAFFPTGRWTNDEAVLMKQLDIYNPSTNKWSIGLLDRPIEAAGIVSINNTLYMGGGRVDKYGCTSKVYTLTW
jgi:hypothetical protein